MARNTGHGYRRGPVKGATDFVLPSGLHAKRDTRTGRIMDVKTTGGHFKGVRREK